MYALGWHDLKLKTIITNCGNTIVGIQARRIRHHIEVNEDHEPYTARYVKEIPRPKIVEDFYKYFGSVDVHDHLRQGSLCLEEVWRTQIWWHRLFTTMLGVVFTDCYLAYRYIERKYHREPDELSFFMGKLAYRLINNFYIEKVVLTTSKIIQNIPTNSLPTTSSS